MPPDLVIIGNPDSKRVKLLSNIVQTRWSQPRLVPYTLLLEQKCMLQEFVRPDSIVRVESPERDFEVEKLLLRQGRPFTQGTQEHLSEEQLDQLEFSKGRILNPDQWYHGWLVTLETIRSQLSECPSHHLINSTDEIGLMYDKTRTSELLRANAIPVPNSLGDISDFATLRARMKENGCSQVFIKLRYGSGGSGAVAYRTNGTNHAAFTTIELVQKGDDTLLFNSRKVRTITRLDEIERLVNRLARFDLHVEKWIPKAGFEGSVFDLRVLTIAQHPTHSVMRKGESTFTNLHLLNSRADVDELAERMGRSWQDLLDTCRTVSNCFPRSLHAGIDVVVHPGLRKHTVLEVNAFGDLLNGVTCADGTDPYTAEMLVLEQLLAERALTTH